MARFMLALILVCGAALSGAQTLQDELQKVGIPTSSFASSELSQGVNATTASDGDSTYLAYMRVDAKNMFTGLPALVRSNRTSGEIRRKELDAGEKDDCCGSPLAIQFTRNYVLISFHDNPSANTVLVTDKNLRLIEILFGFDIHEVEPDVVSFTENMMHFAAEHAEREMLVDLTAATSQEIYPPKGDALRAEFAKIHEQHMPSAAECEEANDPCDPGTYDEDLTFLEGPQPGQFQLLVTRTAAHEWASKANPHEWPIQHAVYTYAKGKHGWLYCEREDTAARLMKMIKNIDRTIPSAKEKSCEPNLPVVADASGEAGPFPGVVRKAK